MVQVFSGNWDGQDGALRIEGDKPTIRFVGGAVAGGRSWILHVGGNGPGNFELYTQSPSGAAGWAAPVLALATDGKVGIGEGNPLAQATGKLVVSVQDTPGLAAIVGVNRVDTPAAAERGAGNGGWFLSKDGEGVRGQSENANHGGVVGVNEGGGDAVFGLVEHGGAGVHGIANTSKGGSSAIGVVGDVNAGTGTGVFGHCVDGIAMHAVADRGIAFLAEAKGAAGAIAGQFNGDVVVTGDIRLVNADCAEDFDVVDLQGADPGTVMSLDDSGALVPCRHAYDKRVAGVISGAGDYRPAIVLDKQTERVNRAPIALMGKVYCKVDTRQDAIEIGDLLTTSATAGHAMKAHPGPAAFGAVIGKALQPLAAGQFGLVPILVALQ